jgi:hypothetical protein
VLSAKIDEFDSDATKALIDYLQRFTGDSTITLIKKEAGSVLLFFRSSGKAYQILFNAYYKKQITGLIGYKIKHLYENPLGVETFQQLTGLEKQKGQLFSQINEARNALEKVKSQIEAKRIEIRNRSERPQVSIYITSVANQKREANSVWNFFKKVSKLFFPKAEKNPVVSGVIYYEEYFNDYSELFQSLRWWYSEAELAYNLHFLYDKLHGKEIAEKLERVLQCVEYGNVRIYSLQVQTDLTNTFITNDQISELRKMFKNSGVYITINSGGGDDDSGGVKIITPGEVKT